MNFSQDSQNQSQDNSTYGINCGTHDLTLQPFCRDDNDNDLNPLPTFCTKSWCQVDVNSCDQNDVTLSNLFGSELYQSYQTCGDEYNFSVQQTNANKSSEELMKIINSQVQEMRSEQLISLEDNNKNCEIDDYCNQFDSHSYDTVWSNDMNESQKIAFDVRKQSPENVDRSSGRQKKWTCEVESFENSFMRIARSEQQENDMDRVGYMQTGFIEDGNQADWPIAESCLSESGYDPRFRPWFSNTSTGPKDVIIIVDVSENTSIEDKISLFQSAAIKIIETFTEFDQASIISFDSDVLEWSQALRPMTETNKDPNDNASIYSFINNLTIQGGRNFDLAFDKAQEIFNNSTSVGVNTSGCQKLILFLTDGESESELDTDKLTSQSQEMGFKVFAQAAGRGTDSRTTKEISCLTGGISQVLPDRHNLSNVMAGQQGLLASGIHQLDNRWIKYQDWITGDTLLASCVANQDKYKKFKGVACMDINVILDYSLLELKSDQASVFQPALTTANTTCPVFDLEAVGIDIENLRKRMGGETCNHDKNIFENLLNITVWIIVIFGIIQCVSYLLRNANKICAKPKADILNYDHREKIDEK